LWTFSSSLLFHGEETSRESREWRWDIVILPLVHLPAFDRNSWDRRHNILDGFDKFGGLFVQGMEICNQLGIVARERCRGHGKWWALSRSSRSNIDCAWCRDSESDAIAMTVAWWAPAQCADNDSQWARLIRCPQPHLFGLRIILQQVYSTRSDSRQNTKAWAGIRPSNIKIQEQRSYSSCYISQWSSQVIWCGSYSGTSKSVQFFL